MGTLDIFNKEGQVCNGEHSLSACVNGCRSEYSDRTWLLETFAVIWSKHSAVAGRTTGKEGTENIKVKKKALKYNLAP